VNILLPSFKIDDPVGAIGVHAGASIWGLIIAVGLFSDSELPAATTASDAGLFYGGGFHLLGLQVLGIVAVIDWGVAFSGFFLCCMCPAEW
jgi:Amt family ammonium transporter